MFKRSLLLLMVLLVGLVGTSFVGLAASGQTEIAFIRASGEAYYQYGSDAASVAADLLGVKLSVFTSNYDVAQELATVQDAIARGVDGILMYAVSLSSERAAIDTAKKAGIPIMIQYGYAPELLDAGASFMQIDVNTFGQPLGEWMALNIPSGEVAIIEGALGRGDAEAYSAGFIKGLSNNRNLKVVAQISADWGRQKAFNAASDIISAHPNLAGLFVHNEDMCVGAVHALERAGKLDQVKVVSMNGAPYGLELVKDGSLKVTNANPPSIASVMALRVLLGIIAGEVEPGYFYWAPTQLIGQKNFAVAIPWDASKEQIASWLELPLPEPVIPAP